MPKSCHKGLIEFPLWLSHVGRSEFGENTAEGMMREKTGGGRGWEAADFILLSAVPLNHQSPELLYKGNIVMRGLCTSPRNKCSWIRCLSGRRQQAVYTYISIVSNVNTTTTVLLKLAAAATRKSLVATLVSGHGYFLLPSEFYNGSTSSACTTACHTTMLIAKGLKSGTHSLSQAVQVLQQPKIINMPKPHPSLSHFSFLLCKVKCI